MKPVVKNILIIAGVALVIVTAVSRDWFGLGKLVSGKP